VESVVTEGTVIDAATAGAVSDSEEGVCSVADVWPVAPEAGCGRPERRVDKSIV